MFWFAQAPANIALIKYMGKSDSTKNVCANPSLSYTLDNLTTSVKLELKSGNADIWEPLTIPGLNPVELPKSAQVRYLKHLSLLKELFNFKGGFIVRSTNNFPWGSGLASSASSFAALTKCALRALSELTSQELPDVQHQANLSRLGSGSSCRSFFSPWALWDENGVREVSFPYTKLIHQVIIIDHGVKEVSSSEAHLRVQTSTNYKNRAKSAIYNLKILVDSLNSQDWRAAYEICWREFQDMHNLFTSSKPTFSYIGQASSEVLNKLQDLWQKNDDGPIVTMDAGSNIHLLYREDQQELALKFKSDAIVGSYDML